MDVYNWDSEKGILVGDWKFSKAGDENDEATRAERFMQANIYARLKELELEQLQKDLQAKITKGTATEEDKNTLAKVQE